MRDSSFCCKAPWQQHEVRGEIGKDKDNVSIEKSYASRVKETRVMRGEKKKEEANPPSFVSSFRIF